MWTARGKTVLNFLEDLTKYPLAFLRFLALNYLPNSETNVFMNFATLPDSEIC